MSIRTSRIIVCEGPDDLGILRQYVEEIARRRNYTVRFKGTKHQKKLKAELEHFDLTLEAPPDGKSGLAKFVNSKVAGSASLRPDFFGVVFDPDEDGPERELKFFERDYNKIAHVERTGSALEQSSYVWQVTVNRRRVDIMPAPWRLPSQTQCPYGLPDHHSLERVLISAILEKFRGENLEKWADDVASSLLELVQDHGWKRAFRIWNAALHPKSESFADKLIQHKSTREACISKIDETPVRDLIERLFAKPTD